MISIKKPKNFQGMKCDYLGPRYHKRKDANRNYESCSERPCSLSLFCACLFALFFFKGKVGVLKLCLGYLSVKRLFQVFLNLAVNRGQIPRWSHSDFTTSGHNFSSFQVPPPSPTQALTPDPEVRAGVRPSKPGSPIGVVFVK